MKTCKQNPSNRWGFACERGKSGYEPTAETAFKREDGMTVGVLKTEVIKSGSPDWSGSKSLSLISVGK